MGRLTLRKTYMYGPAYTGKTTARIIADRDITVCISAVEELFNIDQYCTTITICTHDEPHPEAYEITLVAGRRLVLLGKGGKSINVCLFTSFARWLRKHPGKYISVEVDCYG